MALLTPEAIYERLRQVRAFRRVPEDVLRRLADEVQVQVVNPGETIYRLGQQANQCPETDPNQHIVGDLLGVRCEFGLGHKCIPWARLDNARQYRHKPQSPLTAGLAKRPF